MMQPVGGFWPFQDDDGNWLWCFVNGGVDYVTASGAVLPDGFVTDFASVTERFDYTSGDRANALATGERAAIGAIGAGSGASVQSYPSRITTTILLRGKLA